MICTLSSNLFVPDINKEIDLSLIVVRLCMYVHLIDNPLCADCLMGGYGVMSPNEVEGD